MSSKFRRARGTPCSYCAVPVLHPNQQCCLNCKNHPFDIIEPNDTPILKSADAPTPPKSPTASSSRAVSTAGSTLVFEIRNINNENFVRISADDLKEEALQRHYEAGLLFEVDPPCQEEPSEQIHDQISTTIISDYAVGIKINGSAFGKTCLHAGDKFIAERDDENMAGSVIIYENNSPSSGSRAEYSISEDSLDYTTVTIKADAKAWYDEGNGHPSPWLFHERTLYKIDEDDGDEAESDFDLEDDKLHGVAFNRDTEGRHIGSDNLYDDRVLVDCEGTEFTIKRGNLIIEVEVNENAYAQKLREGYDDLEQFWFQLGDKVWIIRPDKVDVSRVIVKYEDEEFSVAKEDLDL